jgi:hypothetical protein
MNRLLSHPIGLFIVAVSVLFLCAGQVQATDIPGTIFTTLVIHDDSELTGDVTCTVADAPCIQLAEPGITLRLNGFTITGPADSPTGCTSTTSFSTEPEDGIEVLQDAVAVLGPGRVRKFRRWGILLGHYPTGPEIKHLTLKHVTFSENCFSGLQTAGITESNIEGNVWARNAGGSNGFPCGGT